MDYLAWFFTYLVNFALGFSLEAKPSVLGSHVEHSVVRGDRTRRLVGKSYTQVDGSLLLSLYFQGEQVLSLTVHSSDYQQETIRYLLLTFGVLHSLPMNTHDKVKWFLMQLEGCIKNRIATSVEEKMEVEKKKTAEAEEARVEAEKMAEKIAKKARFKAEEIERMTAKIEHKVQLITRLEAKVQSLKHSLEESDSQVRDLRLKLSSEKDNRQEVVSKHIANANNLRAKIITLNHTVEVLKKNLPRES